MMPLVWRSVLVVLVLAGCSAAPSDDRQAAPPAAVLDNTAEFVSQTEADPLRDDSLPELLSKEQLADGWIALFDGHSLFGWQPNRASTNWTVENGTVWADGGEPGLLMTTVEWADYELTCDVRLEKGGNSGIFLRSAFDPKDPAVDCYELNVCDSHPSFPTGSLVARAKLEPAPAVEGDWHTFHVRLEKNVVVVSIDGKEVLHSEDRGENSRRSGRIGLQMNGGKAEFRNVFLRPLGLMPLFNGQDLTGWRAVPGSKSEFKVIEGTIHVTGGRGFLETEQTWDDFVLRADVKTNGQHLNSGIFFRALPGTEAAPSHGYELQIHNGFRDGDRRRPIDFGTGAIFRRQSVRRVVSDDHEWCTLWLVAQGPRFATWVNGYPVVDWTDTRPPHENPREGQRLKAGHISLQGHDPTTDLLFRNLALATFPGRSEVP